MNTGALMGADSREGLEEGVATALVERDKPPIDMADYQQIPWYDARSRRPAGSRLTKSIIC